MEVFSFYNYYLIRLFFTPFHHINEWLHVPILEKKTIGCFCSRKLHVGQWCFYLQHNLIENWCLAGNQGYALAFLHISLNKDGSFSFGEYGSNRSYLFHLLSLLAHSYLSLFFSGFMMIHSHWCHFHRRN